MVTRPSFATTLKADRLLVENLRVLLRQRGADAKDLAQWCGHKPAWLSKIMKGERGMRVDELGMVADFFGLTVCGLFDYGIGPHAERRKRERRAAVDRRQVEDRRQGGHEKGAIHPDAQPILAPKNKGQSLSGPKK